MNKNNCKKGFSKKEAKDVPLSLRITKKASEWIEDNGYGAADIFNEALKELGYKE